MIECIIRQTNVEMPPSPPEWTDGMRQTIDQTVVDNVRESLLRDLSFDPVTIDDLFGRYEQPVTVVWAAILELDIAGLATQHYGNHVARIAQQYSVASSKNRQIF